MSTLEGRAEVLKLERLVEADDLGFLADLPPEDLRAFREQVTDRLFGAAKLGSVAGAARLLPAGALATIAQRAFGPLLCARVAGGVDPKTAIDVARRLPPEFLADVAIHIDPRRVARIIAGVPPELVPGVAAVLGEREEYVTMGRFLAFVSDAAIAAAIAVLSDEAMVRTAFVLEHKERLDHAIGLLPPDRIPGVLRFAAANDLWPEALDLLDHLSDERRGPIADVVAEDATDVLDTLVVAVHEAGLWDVLLPIVRTMQPDNAARLAQVPAFHEPDVLQAIIAAVEPETLPTLLGIVEEMDPDLRAEAIAVAATVIGDIDQDALADLVAVAIAPDTIAILLQIAAGMDPKGRAAVVAIIDGADHGLAEPLIRHARDIPDAAAALRALPPDVHAAIVRAAERLGETELLAEILQA